jgi:hypothetical protein
MAEVDATLLRRLDKLDQKVRMLEEQPCRLPSWCMVLACGFLGGWLGHLVTDLPRVRAQADGAIDIVARSIKIVDERGKHVVEFAPSKFGGGVGRIYDEQGVALVTLEGNNDGGYVLITGHDGLERGFLGVANNKGGGYLHFRNAQGKNFPLSMGVGPRGGYLNLNNIANNNRAVWLGSDDVHEGILHICDNQGRNRCDLGSNMQGGAMLLYGSKRGKINAYLGTGNLDLGGLLLLHDNDGKVRTEMGQGRTGGYLTLNGNRDDRPHLGLTTYDDQRGGLLQIKGNSGKMLVELGIDAAGVGYIDANEKK